MANQQYGSTVRVIPETLELLKRERERIGVPFAQIVKRAVAEYLTEAPRGICIECDRVYTQSDDNALCPVCAEKED